MSLVQAAFQTTRTQPSDTPTSGPLKASHRLEGWGEEGSTEPVATGGVAEQVQSLLQLSGSEEARSSFGSTLLTVLTAALVLFTAIFCIAMGPLNSKRGSSAVRRGPPTPTPPPAPVAVAERPGSSPMAPSARGEAEDPFHLHSFRAPHSSPDAGHSSGVDPEGCLCPDLVVPPDCECVLLVPTRSLGQGAVLRVTDTHGNIVLSVEPRPAQPSTANLGGASPVHWRSTTSFPVLSPPGSQVQAGGQAPRFVLNSIYNDLLAQCGPAPHSRPGPREFHLLRASGELFARLRCGEGTREWSLVTRSGARLNFWGSPQDHALNVAGSSGRFCATTEPVSAKEYKLRVAPLMDVGLILCGVLCIQLLA